MKEVAKTEGLLPVGGGNPSDVTSRATFLRAPTCRFRKAPLANKDGGREESVGRTE